MDSSSKVGPSFQKENPTINKEVNTPKTPNTAPAKDGAESGEDLNAAYVDHRSVTISPVRNYSLYRKANDKALPNRRDFIGSSLKSSQTLAANKGEIEAYFPNLIGLAPNNPNFITRVKQYLNNIQIPVDALGKKFDTSFRYNHKKDYLNIKAKEEEIEREYQLSDRSNIGLLRTALENKINRLNELESTKYELGYPLNISDYLMYRHCLLYKDVAKDTALINGNENYRFYIKDDAKEEERMKKHRIEINKAKANYVKCIADPELFEAVYIQYCLHTARPVSSSIIKSQIDKESELDTFSSNEPVYFNNICANRDVKLSAKIEKLIVHNELVRYKDNQNITTTDGTFIGSNMKEVISWFKNPANSSLVESFFKKLEKYN